MSQPTKARHGATTNHHREAGIGIIPTSRRKDKEENMGYLSELTAHERLTVDNATLDMFTAFENGSDLIYDIWEQYFSDRERKNIESRDLEFIGRILYVRSALLVAQYSKKFFVRWDDRAMCELRDIVVHRRIAV